MKQTYIGTDIIEINRIQEAMERWGERFLRRVFTDSEIELYGNKLESLAARFAGKEAAMKALNAPLGSVGWKEIEVLSESNGKPVLQLYGRARERAQELKLFAFEISLSHSREFAIAFVICLR